jgi:hypothetical protein
MGSKFFKAEYDTTTHRKCKVHGVMPIEGNFYACKGKSRHGKETVVYRCVLCQRATRKARYQADPQASHDSVFAWKLANPEATKAISARTYEKNKHKYLPRYKDKRIERKLLVLGHYADGKAQCALCQEPRHQFLALDQIDGQGTFHHELLGPEYKGEKFYKWVIEQKFPGGYRVLCHNHNFKEHLRHNREAFEAKVWDDTNSHKTRVINGKEYPVDLRKDAIARSKYYAAIKLECLVHYSSIIPSCACCGEQDQEVLSIDHIGGDGRKHRREVGLGNQFYKHLVDAGFPSGYRVLCWNCNFSFGLYGECPHCVRPIL